MKQSFDSLQNWILKIEGGYVNDPRDAGGETKFGISKRAYPSVDIPNLTIEQAMDIYKADYWNINNLDEFPFPLDICVFDWAINSGNRVAVRRLQHLLNRFLKHDSNFSPLTPDGIIGGKTMEAINQADIAILSNPYGARVAVNTHLVDAYLLQRVFFYITLTKVNSKHRVFLRGWINRVYALANFIKLEELQ